MNDEEFEKITERLNKGLITGKLLLDKFRMLDDSSRNSLVYSNNRYAPFFYHLGREMPVKSILDIDFGLGISSGCYIRGCETTEEILAFQQKTENYYSSKLGINNIKDYYRKKIEVYVGNITDKEFQEKIEKRKWQLIFINDKHNYDETLTILELGWQNLDFDGTILIDGITEHKATANAYNDFCKRKNRTRTIFNTRFGMGVITK